MYELKFNNIKIKSELYSKITLDVKFREKENYIKFCDFKINGLLNNIDFSRIAGKILPVIIKNLEKEYIFNSVKLNLIESDNKIHTLSKDYNFIFLGIGTNRGNKISNLKKLLKILSSKDEIVIDDLSSIYESEPVGYKNQNNFYNMVIKARTILEPVELLGFIKEIEKDMGRDWSKRNHPRKIDIDILFYNNYKIEEPDLTIPHKEIYNRGFVLKPLVEIEEHFRDPVRYVKVKPFLKETGNVEKVMDKKELL